MVKDLGYRIKYRTFHFSYSKNTYTRCSFSFLTLKMQNYFIVKNFVWRNFHGWSQFLKYFCGNLYSQIRSINFFRENLFLWMFEIFFARIYCHGWRQNLFCRNLIFEFVFFFPQKREYFFPQKFLKITYPVQSWNHTL